MQPHLNAHTYIGEMFDFMGHFAELYVGRVGIARRKNFVDVESQCTSFHRRSRFTNAAFGEIKKQLVSCYYPSRFSSSFSCSFSRRVFSGSAMEFSRNEDDELRSPRIMARSIPTRMPKIDDGLGQNFAHVE